MSAPSSVEISAITGGSLWQWLAHTVQWGNAQEMITWLVAGVALLYAARAAKEAKKANARQDEQLKKLAVDEERKQAELVAAWFEWIPRTAINSVGFEAGAEAMMAAALGPQPTIVVQNNSPQPVYEFFAWANTHHYAETILAVERLHVLPTTRTNRPVKLPDSKFNESTPIRTAIIFRDSASRRWMRDNNGELRKLTPEEWKVKRDRLFVEFGI